MHDLCVRKAHNDVVSNSVFREQGDVCWTGVVRFSVPEWSEQPTLLFLATIVCLSGP